MTSQHFSRKKAIALCMPLKSYDLCWRWHESATMSRVALLRNILLKHIAVCWRWRNTSTISPNRVICSVSFCSGTIFSSALFCCFQGKFSGCLGCLAGVSFCKTSRFAKSSCLQTLLVYSSDTTQPLLQEFPVPSKCCYNFQGNCGSIKELSHG